MKYVMLFALTFYFHINPPQAFFKVVKGVVFEKTHAPGSWIDDIETESWKL